MEDIRGLTGSYDSVFIYMFIYMYLKWCSFPLPLWAYKHIYICLYAHRGSGNEHHFSRISIPSYKIILIKVNEYGLKCT
jgi:hypothetical protein